jgi:two-component system, cell cycle response regulator DivK
VTITRNHQSQRINAGFDLDSGINQEQGVLMSEDIKKDTGPLTGTNKGLAAQPSPLSDVDTNENEWTDSLTVHIPSPVEIKATSNLPQSPQDILVLVVDDIVDNVLLLSLNLQRQGYQVVTASNGEEAVRIARLLRPNIILMDIGMPELDGLGATRKIREDAELRAIPVIAVTAFSTSGFRRAAYDVGFDGYLTKPIEFQQLHELMNRLLA